MYFDIFKKCNVNADSMIKINNDFEMDALIAEYVENKFLNFELFWKDVKNVENDSNMLKIYFLDFFFVFHYFFFENY